MSRTCIICDARLTKASRTHGSMGVELCDTCYDRAGLENDHNDNGHPVAVDNCPTCEGEAMSKLAVVPAPVEEVPVTERKPYFDHSNCDHEKTPKARAACRAKGEAAEYYGRDKIPAQAAPTKTRKGRKAKREAVVMYPIMWASKGTGAITHWAIVDDEDTAVPACGNTIKHFTVGHASEVKGCNKCRAMNPADLVSA